jgi:hypothetical protein
MRREIFTNDMRPSLMYGGMRVAGTMCSSWSVQHPPRPVPIAILIDRPAPQSNGEKMSPGPIETILRSSNLIADVLVVGSNKPQIGCLLFPRTFPPPSDLVKQLADLIAQANEQSPSHAQLGDEMCLVISDPDRAAALPKSSKGTIQRGVAYDVYKDEIDAMYGESNGAGGDKLDISGEELQKWLVDKVGEIMGDGKRYNQDVLDAETDLFSWGVDSVKAARLRFAMMKVRPMHG